MRLAAAWLGFAAEKERELRVLTLPSWFPSAEAPVAGSFIDELVGALAAFHPELQNDVILLRPEVWLAAKRPLRSLVTWARLNGNDAVLGRDPRGFGRHELRTLWWTEKLSNGGRKRAARKVYELCRQLEGTGPKFDLVHAHVVEPAGRVGFRVAKLLGIPLVLSEQMSPFPFPELVSLNGSLEPDVQRAFASAGAVIAPSEAQAADIRRWCGCEPVVIPNGCDEQTFSPNRVSVQRETVDLVAVGGLVRQKGFDILLDAFARARAARPRLRLTICGDGPDGASLREQAERLCLGDSVRWAGLVSRADMPQAFQGANAFVLSSRHESFGVVCIEAIATGIPVLATDCGGPRDIVNQTNGILVAVDSVDALADGLIRLHDEMPGFDSAAIRADFLRRFSFRAVTGRVVELYERVIEAHSRDRHGTTRLTASLS